MTASHRSQTRSDHHPDRAGEATACSSDPPRVSTLSFRVAGSTNGDTPPAHRWVPCSAAVRVLACEPASDRTSGPGPSASMPGWLEW